MEHCLLALDFIGGDIAGSKGEFVFERNGQVSWTSLQHGNGDLTGSRFGIGMHDF